VCGAGPSRDAAGEAEVSVGAVVAVVVGALLAVVVLVLGGALVSAGALVVVVGAVVGALVAGLVLGADAIWIGELAAVGASDMEKPMLVGVELLELGDVALDVGVVAVVAAVLLATVVGSKPPVIVVTVVGAVTTGTQAGPLMHAPLLKRLAVLNVVETVVGTTTLVRFQLGALPVSVSVFVTEVCNPVTAVPLLSVADDAITGPPAPMLPAVRLTVLVPASMVAGISAPLAVSVIPLKAVALTAPPKLLLALLSVIAPPPACRLVAPATSSGPLCAMAPLLVSVKLPALLAASCVAELSVKTTEPVVFTSTLPKFAVPCETEMAPPPVAVNDALPPTVRISIGWSRKVMLVPVKAASPVTVWLVPASEIEPRAVNTRLPALLLPVTTIAESSETATAPAAL
jgi:hypothetical protein